MSNHPHSFSRYCMHCGQRLATAVPEGDTRTRLVCLDCGFIHYINPRPVAGVLPVNSEGSILLLRRAMEPSAGLWVFPGGFMDVGETAEEAAIRETREETNVEAVNLRLVGVYTRIEAGVVVIVYEGDAIGEATAGDEASEVRWFRPGEIPWHELAFDTTEWALRSWLEPRD